MAPGGSGSTASPPGSEPAARAHGRARATDESPRTTKPYDRTGDQIKLDEVERVGPRRAHPTVLSSIAPRRSGSPDRGRLMIRLQAEDQENVMRGVRRGRSM